MCAPVRADSALQAQQQVNNTIRGKDHMITAVNPKITRVSPLFMFHGKEHKRLLALYMAVVVLHACEHILQLYQFAVLGWARPASGGLLGLWAPPRPPLGRALRARRPALRS